MYIDISAKYSKYLRHYMKVSLASEILTDPAKTLAHQLRQTETAELLGNHKYFSQLSSAIFAIFQNANFCLQTRLMTNVIFMLLRDQIQIYHLYHNNIVEVLERFHTFTATEAQLGLAMYENFVKLIETLKTKARKLIYTFNFAIKIP